MLVDRAYFIYPTFQPNHPNVITPNLELSAKPRLGSLELYHSISSAISPALPLAVFMATMTWSLLVSFASQFMLLIEFKGAGKFAFFTIVFTGGRMLVETPAWADRPV